MKVVLENKFYDLKKHDTLWKYDSSEAEDDIRKMLLVYNKKLGEYELRIYSNKDKCIFSFTSGGENILGKYIYNKCIGREKLRPSLVAVLK